MSPATSKRASPQGYLFLLPWTIEHPGGVNEAVRSLILEFWATRRARPALLCYGRAGPGGTQRLPAGVPVLHVPIRAPLAGRRPLLEFIVFALTLPAALIRLKRALEKEHVGVVNLHYPSLCGWPFVVLRRLRLARVSLVLSFHGLDLASLLEASRSGWGRWLWRRQLEAADRLVACSRSLADDLVRALPEHAHKIEVIHNGVSLADLEAEARQSSLPLPRSGARLIVNVSAFEKKKNLDLLVRAFAHAAASVPNLHLAIAGREGSEFEAIRDLARALGVEPQTTLYVRLPHCDVIRLVQNAEMYVHSSRAEPFGIAILEAAALGVPVVATRVGGVPEIIPDASFGHLVASENVSELAAAIEDCAIDRAAALRRAGRLRERVLEQFTRAAAARRYLTPGGLE
jgi:glycosyltransferase involved in cell wall biosynthesis